MSTRMGQGARRGRVHPKGENSMAVSGLGCSVGARWAVLCINWPNKNSLTLFNTFSNI